jgi:hypothetical protein
MSTTHHSTDESMNDEAELMNLWENEGQAMHHLTNNSDHHMILMLSMTEVEMEPNDHDDSFSMMSDYNYDNTADAYGWDVSSGNHPVRSRSYSKSVPSFYGDDDEDEDYESFEDYSDELQNEIDDGIADEMSTSHVSIRTPPQDDPQAFMFRNGNSFAHHCEVTPEPPTNVTLPMISMPQISEVQIHVQRTLRKLACSMRRSDETRIFLKRQRLQYQLQNQHPKGATSDDEGRLNDNNDNNCITADAVQSAKQCPLGIGLTRCSEHVSNKTEVDLDRRRVYHMIQMGLQSASSIAINNDSTSL